jgi:class 3 adenylate cyclase
MFNFYQPYRRAIEKAVAALTTYGIEPSVQQRLANFLQQPDSRWLDRANPRAIAQKLNLTEAATLQLLVIALKQGIVTLNWEIQCPKCNGIDLSPKRLSDLGTQHTCPACRYVHLTHADDQVRVTFSIDQRLRKLPKNAKDPKFRAEIDARFGVVSGHRLLTVQTFRELFPRETIPPNESLLIRRVAILFTDLAGSTALYSRNGDAFAYSLVRQHFNVLFELVARHNGAVVKTIGDAIMAAFTVPADAFAAAIAMQKQMQILNQQLHLLEPNQLILKVGIDAGPCISVTLNERPDYFGMTVNTAARVQGLSKGNDIVVTDSVLADIKEQGNSWEQNEVQLKGLEKPIRVHTLRLFGEKFSAIA